MMFIKYSVFIMGAGGTGGNFAKEFSRFIATTTFEDISIQGVLIDGDMVENSNLERQPFMEDDVNENKALALSQAIEETFRLGRRWNCYPHYMNSGEELFQLVRDVGRYDDYHSQEIHIIVGCVDNHRARQCMEEVFQRLDTCIYLDAANEYSVGEVVCAIKLEGKVIAPPRSYYFPEVLTDKGKRASEVSCGMVNVSKPQHLATNLFAATLLMSMIVEIIGERNLLELGGITYFDRRKGFSRFHAYGQQKGSGVS